MKNQKFEDNRLENTYEHKNFIVRWYFRWKVMTAILLAGLIKEDIILDYGCGGGWLEKKLANFKIYGYDINPKKTFIKDYRKIKPTKIFALDVFEHIPKNEIKKIINGFKKLNNKFELIVSIPTENRISRKIRGLVGKKEVPDEHITKYEDILKILMENFELKKKVNFFTVTHTFLFEHDSRKYTEKASDYKEIKELIKRK
ncbi:MAG: hypothetical protein AABW90_00930 [Nanoarchaeota archaeon]